MTSKFPEGTIYLDEERHVICSYDGNKVYFGVNDFQISRTSPVFVATYDTVRNCGSASLCRLATKGDLPEYYPPANNHTFVIEQFTQWTDDELALLHYVADTFSLPQIIPNPFDARMETLNINPYILTHPHEDGTKTIYIGLGNNKPVIEISLAKSGLRGDVTKYGSDQTFTDIENGPPGLRIHWSFSHAESQLLYTAINQMDLPKIAAPKSPGQTPPASAVRSL